MSVQPTSPYPRLRWPEKLATLATWGCAVAVFATVGWMAIRPLDPQGAVRITAGNGLAVFIPMTALAAVVAAVATAAIGRKLPDAGTFAVAVGLAAANLQGTSAQSLLQLIEEPGPRRILCLEFAVEAVIWFSILVVAMISSGLVMRWCFGRGADTLGEARLSAMCIAEMPGLRRLAGGVRETDRGARTRVGLLHGLVVGLLALLLIRLLAAGNASQSIQQGQVYFAVAAAFFLGSYAGHRWFPVQTPLTGCLVVPIVCIIGYLWTMVRIRGQGPYAEIASVPPTVFIRALPLEYIAVGTAGVLAAFWGRPGHAAPGDKTSEARAGKR